MSNLHLFGRALRDYAAGKPKSARPMIDRITHQTLRWAQDHDWGKDAFLVGDTLCGLNHIEVHATGIVDETIVSFDSRRALRAWAGY